MNVGLKVFSPRYHGRKDITIEVGCYHWKEGSPRAFTELCYEHGDQGLLPTLPWKEGPPQRKVYLEHSQNFVMNMSLKVFSLCYHVNKSTSSIYRTLL